MTSLPKRPLGKNGPQVSRLGFGLMGLSGAYGAVDSTEDRLKVLDRAYELGETFWDSADVRKPRTVYADSEELVGEWFKRNGKRDDIFLATKFALSFNGQGGTETHSDPEYVKAACTKSLQRLDTVPTYKNFSESFMFTKTSQQRVDRKTPIEKTVEAMAELKKEGKIRYLGLSEVSSETLRRAHAVHPIACVQMEYSPFATDIEDPKIALLKTCRELGVATVAYSPLGRGLLTGVYKSPADFEEGDFRKLSPRFSEENFPKNLELVEHLEEIAKKKNCTSGQLSLAWLMSQGSDVFPIPYESGLEDLTATKAWLMSEQRNQEDQVPRREFEILGCRLKRGREQRDSKSNRKGRNGWGEISRSVSTITPSGRKPKFLTDSSTV
ncbi:MAG: hypothetical protein Q9215_005361 [Flavoplaca cf. flavocitrina]